MKIDTAPLKCDRHVMEQMFTGRTVEVDCAVELLKRGMNCGVASAPGMGKTTFMHRVAAELDEDYKIIHLKMPSRDTSYFYKKLLYELAEASDKAAKFNERLVYTQEVETMFRFLLSGFSQSHADETKALDLLTSALKNGVDSPMRILSIAEMQRAVKKLLKNDSGKIIIALDDLDKSLCGLDETDTIERMIKFFMEISSLLSIEGVPWIIALPEDARITMDELDKNSRKTQMLSVFNDVIHLMPFDIPELIELLEKRLDGDPGCILKDDAARLLFSFAKGNPRTLIFLLTRMISRYKDPADASEMLEITSGSLNLDEKSLFILKRAAEESYILPNDPEIRKETGLDSVSVSMRLSEMAGRRLLVADYIDKQRIYRLSYIHGESIIREKKS